jgi:hypothetical protein
MVASPKGLGPENAGKGQRGSSSRQRRRPTKTRPQLSNRIKYLVMSPRWGSIPRLTDWLTVSCNVTLTLTLTRILQSRVEAWSNTSTVVSRGMRRKGNPGLGGVTVPPCSLAISLRGAGPPGWASLESEAVKYGHESPRLGRENGCAGEGHWQL